MINWIKGLFKPTEESIKKKWHDRYVSQAGYLDPTDDWKRYLEIKKFEKAELKKHAYQ